MSARYESPLSSRYASDEMQYIFSSDKKFRTWRRLWIALAKAQQKLGLPITDGQIAQLERFKDDINYDVAIAREKETRHDVMSHVYAYGVQCPDAKGIIHLGATSCYVGDNTDIILMREGLELIKGRIVAAMALLADFALGYKDMPALAYTHLQPAQLTTVGKRASLWLSDLLMDYEEIDRRIASLRLLGSKGTTGTQASFVELFNGDDNKIRELDRLICEEMGFEASVPVSGQTYSRKVDAQVLAALSGIAQTAGKFSSDMRLLSSFKEMEEPFEAHQIGSSAMPYKRNPMRSERMAALARYIIVNSINPALTASTQWFERTLDDSANKRIAVSEAFLASDAILILMVNVCDGLVVYPNVIRRRVMNELPFMATENIMMNAVKKGGDRQQLHESLRMHSIEAGRIVKDGGHNDLLDRIAGDGQFMVSREELDLLLDPEKFTGRSAAQTEEFIDLYVRPVLRENSGCIAKRAEIRV